MRVHFCLSIYFFSATVVCPLFLLHFTTGQLNHTHTQTGRQSGTHLLQIGMEVFSLSFSHSLLRDFSPLLGTAAVLILLLLQLPFLSTSPKTWWLLPLFLRRRFRQKVQWSRVLPVGISAEVSQLICQRRVLSEISLQLLATGQDTVTSFQFFLFGHCRPLQRSLKAK